MKNSVKKLDIKYKLSCGILPESPGFIHMFLLKFHDKSFATTKRPKHKSRFVDENVASAPLDYCKRNEDKVGSRMTIFFLFFVIASLISPKSLYHIEPLYTRKKQTSTWQFSPETLQNW